MSEALPVVAILGGTGELGTGLARRWVQAGYQVIIGSRTADKAVSIPGAAIEAKRPVLVVIGVSLRGDAGSV